MYLKTVCCAAVVLCGWLLGWEGRRRLETRVKSIEMFRSVFLEMKSMVAHSGLTLEDMALELSDRREQEPFLSKLRECLSECPFPQAWKQALCEMQIRLCLSDEDVLQLTDCASLLGKSDIEGELHALDLIGERLLRRWEEAHARLVSNGKIYTAIGASAGMILALLLI